jgi:hypothetical protein
MVGIIRFLIGKDTAEGAYNASAPNPVTNRDFSRTLAEVLHRHSWLAAPAAALRLALGEMADALLLSGQRAIPERLLEEGYNFHYPELAPALRQILN